MKVLHSACSPWLLDYSDKNVWNDKRQIIILYEKSQFNSPVWSSFTLAPINTKHYTVHRYIGATYIVKWCTKEELNHAHPIADFGDLWFEQ